MSVGENITLKINVYSQYPTVKYGEILFSIRLLRLVNSVLQAFWAHKSMSSKSQVVLSLFSNFLELQVDTAGNMTMKFLITFGILCTFSNLMELHSY